MALVAEDTKFIYIFRTIFNGFNLARAKSLLALVHALSSVRTVNLVKVAAGMNSPASMKSTYRRIQRFVHEIRLDSGLLAAFLVKLAGIQMPCTLVMDRTNLSLRPTTPCTPAITSPGP